MKRPSHLTSAAVGALGLLLMLVNHFHGHRMYLDHLNTARTLYHPLPASAKNELPAQSLGRRLWILVLDGLRDDVADTLPNVRRLALRGARRTLQSEFPSFTYPNISTMASGVMPFYSGVRLNGGRTRVRVDTLLEAAARKEVPTVIVAKWEHFDQALDPWNAPNAEHTNVTALRLRPPAREIAWVHFVDIDEAGHRHGAASPQYLDAARQGDSLLGELADALDPSQDVLVALSDHGHRARGGHGGVEPEVLHAFFLAVGPHVRTGVRLPSRRMRDVCATLAILGGIPPPRDNLGAPMLDLLDLPAAGLARALAPAWVERARADAAFNIAILEDPTTAVLARALSMGEASAVPFAQTLLREREQSREVELADRLWARERRRLEIAGGVVLLFWALVLWVSRSGVLVLGVRDFIPLCAYLAVFLGLYHGMGYPLGWSIPRGAIDFMVETAVMGVLAAVVALVTGRLRWVRCADRTRQVQQAAAALVLLWPAYVLAAAAAGSDPAWLAGPRTSFGLVLLATLEFYVAGALGVAAIVEVFRKNAPDSSPAMA